MAGGPAFLFFFPVPELRVPRPCVFGKGGYDAADTILVLVYSHPALYAFAMPALRNVREGRGTHWVAYAKEIKSVGHPPWIRNRLRLLIETGSRRGSDTRSRQESPGHNTPELGTD